MLAKSAGAVLSPLLRGCALARARARAYARRFECNARLRARAPMARDGSMIGAGARTLGGVARRGPSRSFGRTPLRCAGADAGDVIGIDLGTTNSCVAVMEVRAHARAHARGARAPLPTDSAAIAGFGAAPRA